MTSSTRTSTPTARSVDDRAAGREHVDEAATAAIAEVFRRLYAAWDANDAGAFAALYRSDATVVMPKVLHHNRNEIRSAMAENFRGALKGSRGVDEPLIIRVIADTAIVVSRAGIIMAGEDELPVEREVHATWVLTRQDGDWLVAAYANAPAR